MGRSVRNGCYPQSYPFLLSVAETKRRKYILWGQKAFVTLAWAENTSWKISDDRVATRSEI